MHPDTGQILISTHTGEEGKYRQNESYFLGGKTTTTIQNFYYSLSREEPLMTIATPLLDKQGNLIAVIAGHVSPVEMSNIMLQRSSSTTTEETFLVNKFNFFSSESRFAADYAFTKSIRTEGVDACLQQNAGSGYYESYQGSLVFGVYRWLPERELCILTEIDQAEAFAPIIAQRNALIGVGAGLVIILALSVAFFARTLTQPILQLVSGAQKIGQGQLNHRINVKTSDEIGQLAAEFNTMAANLNESNQSLTRRLNFERLVSELSVKFISLPSDQIDAAIDLALAEIARFVDVTRSAVFLLSDSQKTFSNTHEWCADPEDSQMALLQNIPFEAIGYYWEFLHRNEDVVISRPEDLPLDVVNAWAWREKHGFRPLLLVPMIFHNELYGAIGFYGSIDEEKEWPKEFLALLRFTSNIFVSVLERQKTEAELHRHRDELALLVAERTSELENSMEKLTRSNEELAQFAYVASHDLQEPLRMVSSYMQLLSRRYEGKLDEEADEFIGFAVDGAQRMQGLINDLLAFSRVGTRGQELVPTDSQTVLDQTLRNLQIAIEESQATIVSDPLPTVMGDAGQLGQLFQNLIGNALKFRSDTPVEIQIRVEPKNEEWLFAVCDNGIGIEPEYRERIFAIFQRLHTRKEYSGTGIGLAVCKKIVERHNGRIWVESALGQGSTFYFTLPREENDEQYSK
jgi:signal transduction histidine kinase